MNTGNSNSPNNMKYHLTGGNSTDGMVDKLLTKVYNQGLVHMGEKASMRMTLKEVSSSLDVLNELMCKQTVQ